MPAELPERWWTVTDAPEVLGERGVQLVSWLFDTVARPHPLLGRPGPLCPFVPAALRQGLLFGTVAAAADHPVLAVEEQAQLFLSSPPTSPDPVAINKSLLVIFMEVAGTALTDAVGQVKGRLITRELTCGEFYPESDDRSARTERVCVARSPVPLVAIRYLTPHDRLFLAKHPQYRPLFEQWEAHRG